MEQKIGRKINLLDDVNEQDMSYVKVQFNKVIELEAHSLLAIKAYNAIHKNDNSHKISYKLQLFKKISLCLSNKPKLQVTSATNRQDKSTTKQKAIF